MQGPTASNTHTAQQNTYQGKSNGGILLWLELLWG